MKRAQAALEFMMTYGWAFMVILVTIGALAYFGVLNPDRFVPDRCTFQQEIQCTDFQATTGDSSDLLLRMFLQNNLGRTINVSEVTAIATDIDSASDSCTGPLTIGAGVTEEVNCTFTGSFSEGSKSKFEIALVYKEVGGRYDHSVFGDVLATVQ